MSEGQYNSKLFKKRIYIWAIIISLLLSGNFIIYFPQEITVNESYIPGIINGLVSATSILVAIALFTFTHIGRNIQSLDIKRQFNLLSILYLTIIFIIFSFGILIGYRFLLADELMWAYNCFSTVFVIIMGIILDMSVVSNKYNFL